MPNKIPTALKVQQFVMCFSNIPHQIIKYMSVFVIALDRFCCPKCIPYYFKLEG